MEDCSMRSTSICSIVLLAVLMLSGSVSAATRGLYLIQNSTDTIVRVIDGVVTGEIEIVEGEATDPIDVVWLDGSLAPFSPSGIGDSLSHTLSDPLEVSFTSLATWQFSLASIGEHGISSIELRLYQAGSLDYTSPLIETHVEPAHAEAEGLRLVLAGDTIVSITGPAVTGEVSVGHLETSGDIEIWFADLNDSLFQPDTADGFELRVSSLDTLIATVAQTGPWSFTVTGVEEGMTSLRIAIFHVDHEDYIAPLMELHVEEEHAEAEGVRLVLGADTLVSINGATVNGELAVPNGATLGPVDVWFVDINGALFQPETAESFLLLDSIADTTIAVSASAGDWSLSFSGMSAGSTSLTLEIFHVDHADYTAPPIPVVVSCCIGTTGNVDGTGNVDIADLTFLVDVLFITNPTPACAAEANIDGMGNIDIADLTLLVDVLFINNPPLPDCQ